MIRRATPKDVMILVDLYHKWMVEGGMDAAGLVYEPDRAVMICMSVLHKGVFFIAEDDGKPVGAISAVYDQMLGDGLKILSEHYFWVDPECRGKGVGSKLIKALEEYAKKTQCKWVIMADWQPGGDVLKEYYGRLGFNAVQTQYWKQIDPEGD